MTGTHMHTYTHIYITRVYMHEEMLQYVAHVQYMRSMHEHTV